MGTRCARTVFSLFNYPPLPERKGVSCFERFTLPDEAYYRLTSHRLVGESMEFSVSSVVYQNHPFYPAFRIYRRPCQQVLTPTGLCMHYSFIKDRFVRKTHRINRFWKSCARRHQPSPHRYTQYTETSTNTPPKLVWITSESVNAKQAVSGLFLAYLAPFGYHSLILGKRRVLVKPCPTRLRVRTLSNGGRLFGQ